MSNQPAKLTQDQAKLALVTRLQALIYYIQREDVKIVTSSINTDLGFYQPPINWGFLKAPKPVPNGKRVVQVKVELEGGA